MTPLLRLTLFLVWVGVIGLCLHFGRRVAPLIEGQGGLVGILLLLAGAGAGVAWFIFKFKSLLPDSRKRAGITAGICVLALLILAWYQPLLIERTHLILYGVLGILAWNLWEDRGLPGLRRMIYAGLLCILVGVGDEFIQHLHPERVGDPRDVLTNALSSLIALIMARALCQGES